MIVSWLGSSFEQSGSLHLIDVDGLVLSDPESLIRYYNSKYSNNLAKGDHFMYSYANQLNLAEYIVYLRIVGLYQFA